MLELYCTRIQTGSSSSVLAKTVYSPVWIYTRTFSNLTPLPNTLRERKHLGTHFPYDKPEIGSAQLVDIDLEDVAKVDEHVGGALGPAGDVDAGRDNVTRLPASVSGRNVQPLLTGPIKKNI